MGRALPTRGRRHAVLGVMCLALMTVVAAVASLNVALPDLARETGPSQSQLQWIVDAYALVFAGLLLPAGALGDRFGRKGILLVGLAVFGGASAVAMLVDDPSALIGLRAVIGVGAALVMPTTLSIVTSVFPPRTLGVDSSYWPFGAGALITGVGLALATSPATTAIVSSLPADRQGIASAVNDLAREVGGAFGIAVLGSVLAAGYRDAVAPATAGLPAPAAGAARDSIAAAAEVGGRAGPRGGALLERASRAFVDGLSTAMLVGAFVLFAASAVVAVLGARRAATRAPDPLRRAAVLVSDPSRRR